MRVITRLIMCAMAAAVLANAQDHVVMRAMRDELARSMELLKLEKLEKPYFISYRVADTDRFAIFGNFGALNRSIAQRSRMLRVEVRVGDSRLDNTNFSSSFRPQGRLPVIAGQMVLPVDDDYSVLRRHIWLATDVTYKKAVEDLSKKRATLQNQVRDEDTPDFTREAPFTIHDNAPAIGTDPARYEGLVRRVSGLFRTMPDVFASEVIVNTANTLTRYVNSEGTSYTTRRPRVTLEVKASTQTADGGELADSLWLYGRSPADLPSEKEISARVLDLGHRLTDLRAAATLENYNGPVLVEGEAAAQMFQAVFVPELLGIRGFVTDIPVWVKMQRQTDPSFVDRIGGRVLPAFLSVTDNPTLTEYNRVPLAGWCKVDDEGVPTRETRLVEKGILKTLLMTRNPVRGLERSTGSSHAGDAAPSNILVTAETAVTGAQLRARLMELVKERDLKFGVVVRRMGDEAAALVACKVFPDGHEELIRRAEFAGLRAPAFRQIVAASKEPNVLTVPFRPRRTPNVVTLDEQLAYTPVTVVAPSILFDDLTLRKIRGEAPKPPVAGHPYFDK